MYVCACDRGNDFWLSGAGGGKTGKGSDGISNNDV